VSYSTQQPVALLERILHTSSETGDLIVDPFCGSGSMLVAAQSMQRRWIGADNSPVAIEITVKRLEKAFAAGFERRTLDRRARQAPKTRPAKAHPGIGDGLLARRARDTMTYDVFISHASEDKEDFVRPLARALGQRGLRVWYDEFTLTVGDSLARSIDEGLAQSRFGVVVLSTPFFQKEWARRELGALVAREIEEGTVILPIWHRVTKDDVLRASPMLADKVALSSSLLSIEELVDRLVEVISRR
jgi:ribosomal protein L11 methylase PrmA